MMNTNGLVRIVVLHLFFQVKDETLSI